MCLYVALVVCVCLCFSIHLCLFDSVMFVSLLPLTGPIVLLQATKTVCLIGLLDGCTCEIVVFEFTTHCLNLFIYTI